MKQVIISVWKLSVRSKGNNIPDQINFLYILYYCNWCPDEQILSLKLYKFQKTIALQNPLLGVFSHKKNPDAVVKLNQWTILLFFCVKPWKAKKNLQGDLKRNKMYVLKTMNSCIGEATNQCFVVSMELCYSITPCAILNQ